MASVASLEAKSLRSISSSVLFLPLAGSGGGEGELFSCLVFDLGDPMVSSASRIEEAVVFLDIFSLAAAVCFMKWMGAAAGRSWGERPREEVEEDLWRVSPPTDPLRTFSSCRPLLRTACETRFRSFAESCICGTLALSADIDLFALVTPYDDDLCKEGDLCLDLSLSSSTIAESVDTRRAAPGGWKPRPRAMADILFSQTGADKTPPLSLEGVTLWAWPGARVRKVEEWEVKVKLCTGVDKNC